MLLSFLLFNAQVQSRSAIFHVSSSRKLGELNLVEPLYSRTLRISQKEM